MSKVKVVFWSGSGNTQAMADAVANGMQELSQEVQVSFPEALQMLHESCPWRTRISVTRLP